MVGIDQGMYHRFQSGNYYNIRPRIFEVHIRASEVSDRKF